MSNINKKDMVMSILPLLALILTTLVFTVFGGLSIYVPLIVSSIIAGAISIYFFKFTFDQVQEFIGKSLQSVAPAILILLAIGVLAASFMYSGIVPSIMFYSMKLITPQIFLPAIMIVTAIVAIVIGSSFTSISTIGIAFFATGVAMGYSEGLIVAAIISGAMFGDKLSPLSDTTNISSMLAGTSLFTHIKNMMTDTLIAFVLAVLIFAVIGFNTDLTQVTTSTEQLQLAITDNFVVSPLLALTPILLIVLSLLKVPVTISILVTSFVAMIIGSIVQGVDFVTIIAGATTSTQLELVGTEEQLATIGSIFNRGGLESMLPTITIIILAATFGGILRFSNMFEHIMVPLATLTKTCKSTIITALLSAILVAFSSGEQYLSIILPTETFRNKFEELNIKPENLSRVAEAGGTVVICLVPWGVLGAFVNATLGVAPFTYMHLTFFAILTPIVVIIRILMTKDSKLTIDSTVSEESETINVDNKAKVE